MVAFGSTGVAQLQPGSETWAPSDVISIALLEGLPLAVYAPMALWVPAAPLPLIPTNSPLNDGLFVVLLIGFMPGSVFMYSPALWPTTAMLSSVWASRFADFSPESTTAS